MSNMKKFTDRSRKVMALANREAHRFNHEYVGTEHILIGLVKEGSGVGANALKNLDVNLRKVRLEVKKLVKSGSERVEMGRLPHTPHTQRVVEFAIEEARNLKHNYIGTEHLLLGLCRETEGLCCRVLSSFGVSVGTVREEVNLLLGEAEIPVEILASVSPSSNEVLTPFSFRFIDHDHRYELLDSANRVIDSRVFDGPVGAYIYNALRKHEASQKLLRDCQNEAELKPCMIRRIDQLLDS